ncbi:hypothetical protein DPMN_013655 [Dreissena polymorpha]|uniref:C-type lectin domain-containing protein n=1 Tax=Dreissena polymorpha TaxID=45954 RepID=A0A9D4N7S6_DREPO|nr:hypothetical protein DPMN_013655 [Dreissena polymorpha]
MTGNDVENCLIIVAGVRPPCTGNKGFCQQFIQPSVLSTTGTTIRALTTKPGTTTRTSTTTTASKSYSSPATLSTTTVSTQTLSTSTVSPPTIPTTTTHSAATAFSAATSLTSSRPAATTKHTPSTLVATTGSSSATSVVPTFTASVSIPSAKSSGIATTNPLPNTTQWVSIGLNEYFVITRKQPHEDAAKCCRNEFNASLVSFASISKYFEIVKPLSLSSDSFWTDGTGTYSSGDPCLALNAKELSLRTIDCELKHKSICTRFRFASNPAEVLAYAPFVEMIKEMTVKRNETKISERKYRSAEDRRTVAKASGGVALSLLLGGFVLVFVNDIVSMLSRLIRNRSA